MSGEEHIFDMWGNSDRIRRIPYPPNLRRIAARIIDPAIGASTCAFGNHKCTMNSGNFTINPPIVSIHARVIDDTSKGYVNLINDGIKAVFDELKIFSSMINMGRDAATV